MSQLKPSIAAIAMEKGLRDHHEQLAEDIVEKYVPNALDPYECDLWVLMTTTQGINQAFLDAQDMVNI